jgi:hypothetical protein
VRKLNIRVLVTTITVFNWWDGLLFNFFWRLDKLFALVMAINKFDGLANRRLGFWSSLLA